MWSMPRSVLQVVAVIIGICAVSGFVLGLRGAPERARLPGESSLDGKALNATDATPLEPAFIPPPPEPELQKVEEEKPEEAAEPAVAPADKQVADAAKAAAAAPRLAVPPPVQEDRVGDLIDGLTPPPEQPPY
jgi:hypothetical protein